MSAVAVASGTRRLLGRLDHWADTRGDRPAVTAADGTASWEAVRADAAALAERLAARGIGPGDAVGLATGRSVHALTALFAVWACGATPVMLDERQPREALAFVVRDAEVGLVLAARVDRTLLALRVPVLTVGDPAPGRTAPTWPAVAHDPGAVAYLVYTSGTTGVPKGVEVTARGLDVLVTALDTLGLAPDGCGVNAVSPAFDGWLWCTLLAVTSGQAVAIVDVGAEASDGVGALLESVRPRTVSLTPSLLAACDSDLDGVETIVVAGEACPPALVERFGAGRRMLNVYGPTETTIAATWADSAAGDDVRDIGRPLPGYHVHVLDDDGSEATTGGTGELVVAGPAVARGYRNQPDLTAARFVVDPCGTGRAYRTGDLVTRLPDGTLRYGGRRDDQVKVRGFRVELAGVDRAAQAVGGVGQAAAFLLAAGDGIGLAATARAGGSLPPDADLRAALARVLPAHAVPSVVLRLDVLPTTGTGKVDRGALTTAAPAAAVATAADADRSRLGPREAQVAAIWGEVLGAPVTDVAANFFAVGGHSLLAARVVAETRRVTGAPVTLRNLLADPTVAGLARAVDAATEAAS